MRSIEFLRNLAVGSENDWALCREVGAGRSKASKAADELEQRDKEVAELVSRLEQCSLIMSKTALAHSMGCRCEICEAVIWNKTCIAKHTKPVKESPCKK